MSERTANVSIARQMGIARRRWLKTGPKMEAVQKEG